MLYLYHILCKAAETDDEEERFYLILDAKRHIEGLLSRIVS